MLRRKVSSHNASAQERLRILISFRQILTPGKAKAAYLSDHFPLETGVENADLRFPHPSCELLSHPSMKIVVLVIWRVGLERMMVRFFGFPDDISWVLMPDDG